MADMDVAREGGMRKMLPLAVLMLSALALSGQQVEQEFSGKVASVNKDGIVLQSSERGTKEFSVDDKLMKQAGLKDLKKGQPVTVFYTAADNHVSAVQIGEQMWHQRECSRENCKCKNRDCKPQCHCKD